VTLPLRVRAALWAALAVGVAAGAPFLGRMPDDALRSAIVFTSGTHDFGTVRAGELVKAEFAFTNESESPVRILRIDPSCGCVSATASSSYVEPHASGTVQAILITDDRSGPQKLRLRVRTDEGADKGARLVLKGEIRVALRPRPPRVFLGATTPGSEHTAEIRVEKLEPVREVAVTCRGDGLSATKLDEDEHGLTLRVTLKVPWAPARHGSGVQLKGADGMTWIPVIWHVEPPFETSAPEIEIRSGRGEISAKPRWPGVALARVETHGLPIAVARDGDRILFTLEGSALDVASGAMIELVPEPASLGNVKIPVYVRPD